MRLIARPLLAVLCALSCGWAPAAQPAGVPAGDINACELLTSAQIATAIGVNVDDGRRQDLGRQADGSYASACIWMIRGESPAARRGRRFVILSAMQWPAGRNMADRYLQSFRDSAAKGVIASQPSPRKYGDEALWWGDGLAVRKDDISFGISVFLPDAPSNQPRRTSVLEEKLAPLILRSIERRAAHEAV